MRFNKKHRHRDACPPLNQALHAGTDFQTAGDKNAGDVRVGRGDSAGQRGDDNVRTISRGDDQAAVFDIFEEITDLHGRNKVVVHQVQHARLAVEHLRAQPALDIINGRAAQGLVLGNNIEGKGPAELLLTLRISGCIAEKGIRGSVDDAAGDIDAHLLQGINGNGRMGADFIRALVTTRGNDQNRCSKVGCDIGIEVKFKARILAPKIGPLAEHEITLGFELLVFLQDVFIQDVFPAGGDQLTRLAQGVGMGVGILDIQLKVFEHQVEIVVNPTKHMVIDNGAEEGNLADLLKNHLHDSKDDGRLAAALFRRCYIQIIRHSLHLALSMLRAGADEKTLHEQACLWSGTPSTNPVSYHFHCSFHSKQNRRQTQPVFGRAYLHIFPPVGSSQSSSCSASNSTVCRTWTAAPS